MTGGDPGGANPARTSSDDEQIDVELSHGHPARMLFLTRFLHAIGIHFARKRFYFLTRFLHANRYPLRSKTLLFLTRFLHANRNPLRSKSYRKIRSPCRVCPSRRG